MVKRETIPVSEVMQHLNDFVQLLTEEQQAELRKNIEVQSYAKNQDIYVEGDLPQHLLCLMKGKVKIYKEGVGNKVQIIRVMKPVEYFGYRAYFANQNYVTCAAAFESSVICRIPMELINRFMMQNIQLSMYFVRQLAIDLGVSDQRTVSLTTKHIRGRLAESLIFLCDSYGLEEDHATMSKCSARATTPAMMEKLLISSFRLLG